MHADESGYREISSKGVTVVIMHGRKILLVKRINIPFISHPGAWYPVAGAKKENETYEGAAYREVDEETGLTRRHLKMLHREKNVLISDLRKRIVWKNDLIVFRSDTTEIRLNIENSAHRWVSYAEFARNEGIVGAFHAKKRILAVVKSYLDKS